MGNIFNEDFRDLVDSFNRWEVKYIMVGGMAVILHGYVRTTGDMDIWVAKTQENYLLICRAFQDFGMSLFDMTEENFLSDKFDVWSFGREPVRVDLMTDVKGLKFDEAMAKAQYYDEEGVTIRYLHLTSLIEAKRASGRHKDLDDIEQLS